MNRNRFLSVLHTLLSRDSRIAWVALVFGMALTLVVWSDLRSRVSNTAAQQFNLQAREVINLIQLRMRRHEQILVGGAGFFDASSSVERAEWRTYVTRLNLKDHYPGIQGMGYSEIIPPAALPAHIARIRAEGFPDYTVRPPGKRDLYTSIIYLEPFEGRNLAAFGYDMYSEATRARAMKRAGESGEPAISGKVKLVQETHGKVQAGFLMYVPVYHKKRPTNTPSERWQALQGFVYSPYRVEDLMQGILSQRNLEVGFRIYDGPAVSEEALMYDSVSWEGAPAHQPQLATTRTIESYGHTWTVPIYSLPQFESRFRSSRELIVLVLGGITSVLLFMIIWSLNSRRTSALQLAHEMTRKIRHNEAALAASAVRAQTIFNTVIDGIITIDPHGIVETFNPAAERIFGYGAEEVIGHNINMLMPEPYRSGHDSYLRNYLMTGKRRIIGIGREVTGRRKNGSTFPMDLAVSEMVIDGGRKFTGIVRDITDRKKAEQLKNEFVSTVSHELRTPLTSIRGALGLVLGGAAGSLDDKGRRLVEMAARNSERLTLLINDLLDFERIESGRMAFQLVPADLVKIARASIEANQGFADRHGVRLSLVTAPPSAPVRADENRIQQVFANLISNAAKFSPAGSTVEVSVSPLNGIVRTAVRDRGAGIPEEFRERIFQRFAQADSSDRREKGGSGLGLSISKAIIEHHGGRIGYETASGQGTTFYFELPLFRDSLVTAASADRGPKILICEDNEDVARILGGIVETEDVGYDIARTVAAARRLLAQGDYAAMLLDLSLPDGDGLSLFRELRAQESTRTLPVIVVSGEFEAGRTATGGDTLDIIDWLQKPVDEKHLKSVLARALGGNRRHRVLHVEDDPDTAGFIAALLMDLSDIEVAATLAEARQRLSQGKFDLAIIDLALPDGNGLELLSETDCPVIVFSAAEPSSEIGHQVAAVLAKSATSSEKLRQTIQRVLRRTGKE